MDIVLFFSHGLFHMDIVLIMYVQFSTKGDVLLCGLNIYGVPYHSLS